MLEAMDLVSHEHKTDEFFFGWLWSVGAAVCCVKRFSRFDRVYVRLTYLVEASYKFLTRFST